MQPLHDWQLPKVQVAPRRQTLQRAPPLPQREGVVWVMHTPATVQQPVGQLAAEQLEPPPSVMPSLRAATHRPAAHNGRVPQLAQTSPSRPHAIVPQCDAVHAPSDGPSPRRTTCRYYPAGGVTTR